MSDKYKTCAKCGVKHSTLVRHKCFKAAKDKAPKLKEVEHAFEKEGETISTLEVSGPCISEGDAENEGEGEGKGDGEGTGTEGEGKGDGDGSADEGDGDGESGGDSKGKGEGSGDGEGDGEGEGQEKAEAEGEGEAEAKGEGEGEGEEGDGEGEGYREAPEPQMPEPEIPPVIVVVSVLKYAALCAQCAKNGNIEITLVEDGLFVYGHNGDTVAVDTIPWGELELRATRDGQFYVKSVIDGVDAKLVTAREEMIAKIAAIPEGKPKKVEAEIEIEIDGGVATKAKAKK